MNSYDIGRCATFGMSLFCLIICLYVAEDIIEIVRIGIGSILMMIFYVGMTITEVVRNGDKEQN